MLHISFCSVVLALRRLRWRDGGNDDLAVFVWRRQPSNLSVFVLTALASATVLGCRRQ